MANSTAGKATAMEEAKHWMWMRRKLINNNEKPYVRNVDDSWEEQAFAEDTAGPLGGFMWPPRSYSCSFCGREFRSAQALGGHMNVHRRDRARLKQSPTDHPLQNDSNPSIILDVHDDEYPSRVYNSNPAGSTTFVVSSSPSRVSVVPISTQENCSTTTTDDSYEEQEKGSLLLSLKLSSTTTTTTTSSDSSKLEIRDKKYSSSKQAYETAGGLVLVQNTKEIVKFDSAVSLNLAMLRPYRPTVSDSSTSNDQEAVHTGCKRRRRTDHVASLMPLSIKSTRSGLLDKCDPFQKLPSSMEELDLELRLGNRPTIN